MGDIRDRLRGEDVKHEMSCCPVIAATLAQLGAIENFIKQGQEITTQLKDPIDEFDGATLLEVSLRGTHCLDAWLMWLAEC